MPLLATAQMVRSPAAAAAASCVPVEPCAAVDAGVSAIATAAVAAVVAVPYYVRHARDGTAVLDRTGAAVTIDRWLATKPLRRDVRTRPGPGGRPLAYVSGATVTRALNEAFGFAGWDLQIVSTEQTVCVQLGGGGGGNSTSNNNSKPGKQSWHVAYAAHVRLTHRASGAVREDVGAGDSADPQLCTAVQHAQKASVTDALKRAARHFGDKLGNCLYDGKFRVQGAPETILDALDQYDQDRARHLPPGGGGIGNKGTVPPVPSPPPLSMTTTMPGGPRGATHAQCAPNIKPEPQPRPTQAPRLGVAPPSRAVLVSHHPHRAADGSTTDSSSMAASDPPQPRLPHARAAPHNVPVPHQPPQQPQRGAPVPIAAAASVTAATTATTATMTNPPRVPSAHLPQQQLQPQQKRPQPLPARGVRLPMLLPAVPPNVSHANTSSGGGSAPLTAAQGWQQKSSAVLHHHGTHNSSSSNSNNHHHAPPPQPLPVRPATSSGRRKSPGRPPPPNTAATTTGHDDDAAAVAAKKPKTMAVVSNPYSHSSAAAAAASL